MATVRNLPCIAFRPEALDVHDLLYHLGRDIDMYNIFMMQQEK